MASASDFLAAAVGQLGYRESPANSNHTKYGEWFGMDYEPWCDIFVSWCADQAGASEEVGHFAYCPYHVEFFKSRGQWLDREEKPKPGDVVFFANRGTACHVGIVEARNGSESVTTIEGNTSAGDDSNGGQVQRRTRGYGAVGSSWYILGFGRPAWDGSPASAPVAPELDASGISVDGQWGVETTTALQEALGTTVDGIVSNQRAKYRDDGTLMSCGFGSWEWTDHGGSEVISTMQSVCGADVDGIAGPGTVRALQERLGVDVDGQCGPQTVRALQERLNYGTF